MNRRQDSVTPEVTMNMTKSSLDQRAQNNIYSDSGKQVNIQTGNEANIVSDFNDDPTVEVVNSKKDKQGRKSKQHRPKTSTNRARASS